ncbi:MAG TPA: hypothetical protein DCX89_04445, partial [Saprospirales bacterium]|nr:hypothetical protein [Saprospirales bacterium]
MDQSFDTYISQIKKYLEIRNPFKSKSADLLTDKTFIFDPEMVGLELDFISNPGSDEINCSVSVVKDYDFVDR